MTRRSPRTEKKCPQLSKNSGRRGQAVHRPQGPGPRSAEPHPRGSRSGAASRWDSAHQRPRPCQHRAGRHGRSRPRHHRLGFRARSPACHPRGQGRSGRQNKVNTMSNQDTLREASRVRGRSIRRSKIARGTRPGTPKGAKIASGRGLSGSGTRSAHHIATAKQYCRSSSAMARHSHQHSNGCRFARSNRRAIAFRSPARAASDEFSLHSHGATRSGSASALQFAPDDEKFGGVVTAGWPVHKGLRVMNGYGMAACGAKRHSVGRLRRQSANRTLAHGDGAIFDV
jgi:hypothetical protein